MKNSLFFNFSSEIPSLKGIIIRNGKIAKLIYSDLELGDYDMEKVDLDGGFLLPGFIDTHTHFLHSALSLTCTQLWGCDDNEAAALMKSAVCKNGWFKGIGYDDSKWNVQADSHFLDKLFKEEKAVIFRADSHSAVVNSAALSELRVPAEFVSDEAKKGIFRGRAFLWLSSLFNSYVDDSDRLEGLEKVSAIAFSKGITSVHALEGGAGWGIGDIEFLMKPRSVKTPKIILYPQITDISKAVKWKLDRIGGCLLIDGSLGSRSAALSEPYEGSKDTGNLYFSDRALFSFIERGHLAGLQLSFHAIGDRGVKQLVDAYDKVLKKHPAPHRHRIEHCMLSNEEEMERIASLGLYLAVQPSFLHFWGGDGNLYEKRLGKSRAARIIPLADFEKKGIVCAAGSDFNVTPLDPILGIASSVSHKNPFQSLSVKSAVELFTKNAAKFSFDENNFGSIKEGLSGDFAVLDKDPFSAGDKIGELKVIYTFLEGIKVFSYK